MNVVNTSVIDSFVGGHNKAENPNIQGCSISNNMITEVNGEVKYLRSLFGKKFYKELTVGKYNCTGSFYASVGLETENRLPSSFWCFNSQVYEVRPSGNVVRILSGRMDKEYGWTFVESGGERPYLLIWK